MSGFANLKKIHMGLNQIIQICQGPGGFSAFNKYQINVAFRSIDQGLSRLEAGEDIRKCHDAVKQLFDATPLDGSLIEIKQSAEKYLLLVNTLLASEVAASAPISGGGAGGPDVASTPVAASASVIMSGGAGGFGFVPTVPSAKEKLQAIVQTVQPAFSEFTRAWNPIKKQLRDAQTESYLTKLYETLKIANEQMLALVRDYPRVADLSVFQVYLQEAISQMEAMRGRRFVSFDIIFSDLIKLEIPVDRFTDPMAAFIGGAVRSECLEGHPVIGGAVGGAGAPDSVAAVAASSVPKGNAVVKINDIKAVEVSMTTSGGGAGGAPDSVAAVAPVNDIQAAAVRLSHKVHSKLHANPAAELVRKIMLACDHFDELIQLPENKTRTIFWIKMANDHTKGSAAVSALRKVAIDHMGYHDSSERREILLKAYAEVMSGGDKTVRYACFKHLEAEVADVCRIDAASDAAAAPSGK